jgi:hypothetical protein
MTQTNLDWPEVNCILEALQALIEKYQAKLANENLDEDEQADLSNDLSYAQILRGKYEDLRDAVRHA